MTWPKADAEALAGATEEIGEIVLVAGDKGLSHWEEIKQEQFTACDSSELAVKMT